MSKTILSSPNKEVIIGFDQPFCVIGERINPTGRKLLAQEMKDGDYSRVEADALAQVAAGATVLDVNAGIPLADEPKILADCIKLVQSITDVPLSIDSSIIEALEAGLSVYQGKALVNSVTGEDESLERVLPLIKKYGAAVVAISNDETGISTDPDVRYAVAKKIVERAADYGIPKEDVIVDPLVMPVGAMNDAGFAGVCTGAPFARRIAGEHHMRCFKCGVWGAKSPCADRAFYFHVCRYGHDFSHYEPLALRANECGAGGQCLKWSRSQLRGMAESQPPPCP